MRRKLINAIENIKPGESLEITMSVIRELPPYHMPGWSVIDGLMEGVMGSSWDMTVHFNPRTHSYFFHRLTKPLDTDSKRRTYVSPDRRHLFKKIGDNLWEQCT